MATYSESNNKPSEVQSKRSILKHHLLPCFGGKRLDVIQQREIETYKSAKLKAGLAPKSVNNHLTILRRILSLATEWGVLTHVPPVQWLKVPEPEFDFLEFEEAPRLEKGAAGEWAVMIIGTFEASWCSATTGDGCCPRASASGPCGARARRPACAGSDGTC